MQRIFLVILSGLIFVLISGCMPAVTLQNQSEIGVRVFVTSRGNQQAVSAAPGESTSVQVAEGDYAAAAVPDQEWVDYARLERAAIIEDLVFPEKMTPEQIVDISIHLGNIVEKIRKFQSAGRGYNCVGSVSMQKDAVVVVTSAAAGAIAVTCQ